MSYFDLAWYCNAGDQSTTGYYAATKWAASTTKTVGALVRQLAAPSVGNERMFVCYSSTSGTGTTGSSEPSWTITRGGQTTDNTVKWQEVTGIPAVNGDLSTANMPNWTTVKGGLVSLGVCIVSNDGTKILLCTTSGFAGSGAEPTWAAYSTSGATTADSSVTWTTIGDSTTHAFSAWAAPHARIQNVNGTNWFLPGNTIFVGDNHAESQSGGLSITCTNAAPNVGKILCVSHTVAPPTTVTTGATVSTTDTNLLTINGSNNYWYGITFKAGNGASTSVSSLYVTPTGGTTFVFDNCQFWLANTAANNTSLMACVGSGNSQSTFVWNNCTVKFATTSQTLSPSNAVWVWQNTGQILVSGSSVPTNLVTFGSASSNVAMTIVWDSIDLSQMNTTINGYSGTAFTGLWMVRDCKLNASTVFATPPASGGHYIQLVRSDSGATSYKSTRYGYEATESTETSITRVGSAADPNGQLQSRKIVTTANVQFTRPFKAEPFVVWNTKTAANVTVTIYGTINAGSVPNNDDIWIEVEYLGTASFPLGVFANSTKANLLAASGAGSSDGSTWNGGGSGAGWSPFKMSVTLSSPQPQFAGYITVKVRAAKASTTYYIDPTPVLS